MVIGIIQKGIGKGVQTSKGIHTVWEYTIIPGGLDQVLKDLEERALTIIYGDSGSTTNPEG